MKILLFHQYFKTPAEGGGIRSHHIARALVKNGHDLTILSGHNELSGIKQFEGFKVCYFKISYANHYGFLRRSLAFLKFVWACQKFIKTNPKTDIHYVISTPLTTGLIGLFGLRKFKIPYIFEVGDLWPEAPVQLGFLKNPLLKKYFYGLEKKIYSHAAQIIALSPAIAQYISQSVSSKVQVSVIPNMADCNFFTFDEKTEEKYSPQNPFQVAYTGALGHANQVSNLLNLARTCEQKKIPVNFHIMGEGAEYTKIVEKARTIPNVQIHKYGGKEEVKILLTRCDAIYVSYRMEPILNTGSPNKFFDGLAAGKVIILTVAGWMEELVSKTNCGLSYNPSEPEAGANLINELVGQPDRVFKMKKNARKLAEERFSVELLMNQFLLVFKRL